MTKFYTNKKKSQQETEGLKPGSLRYVWRELLKSKSAILGMTVLVLLLVLSFLSPYICRYDYGQMNAQSQYAGPSFEHLLGCDELGRDILSRVLYGARYTFLIGILSTVFSAVAGVALGAIAGYFGGLIDSCLMRFLDVFQAFPMLILAMAFCAVFGTGIDKCILALGITGIPGFARLMRANILRIRNMEYIEAAVSIDNPSYRIIIKHVIPNAFSPIVVEVAMSISRNGLASSSLSFLGLGVQPPTPEWGAMLSSARNFIRFYPHMVIVPGVFILITLLSFNLIGDRVRDILDPTLKD